MAAVCKFILVSCKWEGCVVAVNKSTLLRKNETTSEFTPSLRKWFKCKCKTLCSQLLLFHISSLSRSLPENAMSSQEHHAYNSASGNTFVLTVSTIEEHICKVTFPCICYGFISMLAVQNFQVEVNEASLRCSLSIKKA